MIRVLVSGKEGIITRSENEDKKRKEEEIMKGIDIEFDGNIIRVRNRCEFSVRLRISDYLGRNIEDGVLVQNSFKVFDKNKFKNGTYILNIENVIRKKFVVFK